MATGTATLGRAEHEAVKCLRARQISGDALTLRGGGVFSFAPQVDKHFADLGKMAAHAHHDGLLPLQPLRHLLEVVLPLGHAVVLPVGGSC